MKIDLTGGADIVLDFKIDEENNLVTFMGGQTGDRLADKVNFGPEGVVFNDGRYQYEYHRKALTLIGKDRHGALKITCREIPFYSYGIP